MTYQEAQKVFDEVSEIVPQSLEMFKKCAWIQSDDGSWTKTNKATGFKLHIMNDGQLEFLDINPGT